MYHVKVTLSGDYPAILADQLIADRATAETVARNIRQLRPGVVVTVCEVSDSQAELIEGSKETARAGSV